MTISKQKALEKLRTWEDDTHLHCGHFRSSAECAINKDKCIYCDSLEIEQIKNNNK